jgi:2-amino-4-hydroxy-6-hydroxymethyldihydropteridine diphosphokinase
MPTDPSTDSGPPAMPAGRQAGEAGDTTLYLGLGSNLGDREAYLAAALARLRALPWLRIVQVSPTYETDPWGKPDQPPFLNSVAKVTTAAPASRLLAACQRIERDLGRQRGERWGPRVVDIDILLSTEGVIDEPELKVPHPFLEERQFVLVPLAEIAPEVRLPSGRTAAEAARPDDPGIRIYTPRRSGEALCDTMAP